MPIVPDSQFKAPPWFRNRHLQTLLANVVRKVYGVNLTRERIPTPDGDFLDVDWSCVDANKLVILSHGMEGHSRRPYMLGMIKELNKSGFDALAWNFRSCSGEMNRKEIFYHGAMTGDLENIIQHAESSGKYSEIHLMGFSLGGSLTLRWLGEEKDKVIGRIKRAAVVSAPIDLGATIERLSFVENLMYREIFLSEFKRKLQAKARLMPGIFDLTDMRRIRNIKDFDDRYSAPLYGFRSADEMYRETSSKHLIHEIAIPTLIINAKDDPFLGDGSYPMELAKEHPLLFLEMPEDGGHVGFFSGPGAGYWSEKRVTAWLSN